MSIGIYKITNLINGKVYIGQSIHIEKRWKEHCQDSANSLISKDIKKYGKENFLFEILEETKDISLLNSLEANYIKQYNSFWPAGYNIVIEDTQTRQQFNKYSIDTFESIVQDIKNNELSFQEIAKKYNLDTSTIYYINRGDCHTLPEECYPLRPVKDVTKKYHYCKICGVELKTNASYCPKCAHIHLRKTEWPNRERLKEMIRSKSFRQIGRDFGVSDNTIKKWCKNNNLPYKKSQIKLYSDEEWEKI